jgi:hypothetical protein
MNQSLISKQMRDQATHPGKTGNIYSGKFSSLRIDCVVE